MHLLTTSRKALFVLAVLGISPALASAGTGEGPVTINAMHLVQSGTGWVRSGSHVYWTTSNGQSWNDITPSLSATQEIQSVYFLDVNHGWIALDDTSDAASAPFSVAATSDGGKTWQSATPPVTGQVLPQLKGVSVSVSSIDFADAQHGWVMYRVPGSTLSDQGLLFATEDGGAHWTARNAPMAGELSFVSSMKGVVYGSLPSPTDSGNMQAWYTSDGGNQWQKAALPLPAKCSSGSCNLVALGPARFDGTEEVLLAGVAQLPDKASYASFTYKSENAGGTWAIDPASLTQGKTEYPQPTALFDGQTLHVRQAAGGAVTLEAGSSKNTVDLPASLPSHSSVTDASFVDPANGWLVLRGVSCAEGFHVPCIHSTEQAQHEELVSISGSSLQSITPTTSTILPGAAGAGKPVTLQTPAASDAEAAPLTVNGPVSGTAPKTSKPAAARPQPMAGAIGLATQVSDNVNGFDGLNMASSMNSTGAQAWWNWSPYVDAEVYLGGINRQTGRVNASLVTAMLDQGWGIAPIYVGYQAPCVQQGGLTEMTPANAGSVGVSDAEDAVDTASNVGIGSGIIYLDVETYTPDGGSCSNAVVTYVEAFYNEAHNLGFDVGIYASGVDFSASTSGLPVTDLANTSPFADVVWLANPTSSVTPVISPNGGTASNSILYPSMPHLANQLWSSDGQRMRQYAQNLPASYNVWPPSGASTSFAAVSFATDENFDNALVVAPYVPQALPAPTATAPSNGGQLDIQAGGCCQFSWNGLDANINAYELVISSDAASLPNTPDEDGCQGSCEFQTSVGSSTPGFVVDPSYLALNTTYYWTVKAYGNFKNGSWSTPESFCSCKTGSGVQVKKTVAASTPAYPAQPSDVIANISDTLTTR